MQHHSEIEVFVKLQILYILNLSMSKFFEGSLINRAHISSEDSKALWSLRSVSGRVMFLSFKDKKRSMDIEYTIGKILDTKKAIFWDSKVTTISYLVHHDTSLQITTVILSQNATKVYDKMRQVLYYKMR